MRLESLSGMMTTNVEQANVDKLVAVVMAIGPERLSSSATLSDELVEEMTVQEFRAALHEAVKQGLIGRGHSSALGVYYYMI